MYLLTGNISQTLSCKMFGDILLIQCTSPIRARDRFDSAIKYFKKRNFDSLISVAESHRFFWKNLNDPKPDYNFLDRPRRQDISLANKSYVETGSLIEIVFNS